MCKLQVMPLLEPGRIIVSVISMNAQFKERAAKIIKKYKAEVFYFDSEEAFSESDGIWKLSQFVVLSAIESRTENQAAGIVQVAKYVAPNACIAVIVGKKVDVEGAVFIKKSGATVVLLEDEYFLSSKIDFIFARYLQGEWIPLKIADLSPSVPVDFTLYYMMPLNGKYVAIVNRGDLLDSERLENYEVAGEFYIKREELNDFHTYMKGISAGDSEETIKRKCRSIYLGLTEAYKDLVMLLTDHSESVSFSEGKHLYDKIKSFAVEMITALEALGEAWDIVDSATFEDKTALDRVPVIASYSGLMSLKTKIGKPVEVMIAALIADIGLLDLSPKALDKLKKGRVGDMDEEEKKEYHIHPVRSLNQVLGRKVPVPENIKNIVLCTHERVDRKGFPNQLAKEKIPLEAYLINFCEKMDQNATIEIGKAKTNPAQARKKTIEDELTRAGSGYPMDFLLKIKALISPT